MPRYVPREEVDTRGLNAPAIQTNATAGRPLSPVSAQRIIDAGSGDWANAFRAVSSAMESSAAVFVRRDDEQVKEDSIKATVAGELGDPFDTQGDRRVQKAFNAGAASRELRQWSFETQDLLKGDWASMTPDEAVGQLNARYKEKRAQYREAGNAGMADAVDRYMVDLIPQFQKVHRDAHEQYKVVRGNNSVSADVQQDLEAVRRGELTGDQFAAKYNSYAGMGVYGLNPTQVYSAIAGAVDGLVQQDLQNLDTPGYQPRAVQALDLLKKFPTNPEDPTSTLYHRGPAADNLQRAESKYLNAMQTRQNLNKLQARVDLENKAELGTLTVEELYSTNSAQALGLSMEAMTSLMAKSERKRAEESDVSYAVRLYTDSNHAGIAALSDKDKKAAEKSLLSTIRQRAAGDADTEFAMMAPYYQNGIYFSDVSDKNKMTVLSVPTMADGQMNPAYTQAIRDYQQAKRMGLTGLESIFGGEAATQRLDDISLLIENGDNPQTAAIRVHDLYQRGVEATTKEARMKLNKDDGMRTFFSSKFGDRPGLFRGEVATADPRLYDEFARLSTVLFATGQFSQDPEKAMEAAFRRISGRTEYVNGELVLKPDNAPLSRMLGAGPGRSGEQVINQYLGSIGQENFRSLFPDFTGTSIDPEKVAVRFNPSYNGLRLIYNDGKETYYSAVNVPVEELGLAEARRNAAFASLEALSQDQNMQRAIQQKEDDIHRMLSSNPEEAWSQIPELHGVSAAQWGTLEDRTKFNLIRAWQVRDYNERVKKANSFRDLVGMVRVPEMTFSAFNPAEEEEKWKAVKWSVTNPLTKPVRMSPTGVKDTQRRGWLRNEEAVERELGLPRGYAAQLMLTRVVESDNGNLREQQGGGPARGIYQMEPDTAEDLLKWSAATDSRRLMKLAAMAGPKYDGEFRAMLRAAQDPGSLERFRVSPALRELMGANDKFAAGLAAMHYYRYLGDNMPDAVGARVEAHIKEYNRGGKANVQHSMKALRKYGLLQD